ncbi:Repetitive proline-rich cell wall protein 1 [Liparis tanakae]|uniref:Repetitive proline-rich cell wall protein 1 n=1 Tax=Liparis tanakae TaxID=230148 RepID=A0A4Z2FRZ5_9TELE|nr:Repetitive proline-rich cell wall protein 1 [Liparis tanakae]
MGRAGIELTTLGLQDDPLTPLSYTPPPMNRTSRFFPRESYRSPLPHRDTGVPTHRGPLPRHPAGLVGAGAQLLEAQRRALRRERLVQEEAAALRALPPQSLEVLVQVLHRLAARADAPVPVPAVLQRGRDARHGPGPGLGPGLGPGPGLGLKERCGASCGCRAELSEIAPGKSSKPSTLEPPLRASYELFALQEVGDVYRRSFYRRSVYRRSFYRRSVYRRSFYRRSVYRRSFYRRSFYRRSVYRRSFYRRSVYRRSVYRRSVYRRSVYRRSFYRRSFYRRSVYRRSFYRRSFYGSGGVLRPLESVYLLGLGVVAVACEAAFPLSPWADKLPFLPLLATSVYCSVGVCYSFLRLYASLLRREEKHKPL